MARDVEHVAREAQEAELRARARLCRALRLAVGDGGADGEIEGLVEVVVVDLGQAGAARAEAAILRQFGAPSLEELRATRPDLVERARGQAAAHGEHGSGAPWEGWAETLGGFLSGTVTIPLEHRRAAFVGAFYAFGTTLLNALAGRRKPPANGLAKTRPGARRQP